MGALAQGYRFGLGKGNYTWTLCLYLPCHIFSKDAQVPLYQFPMVGKAGRTGHGKGSGQISAQIGGRDYRKQQDHPQFCHWWKGLFSCSSDSVLVWRLNGVFGERSGGAAHWRWWTACNFVDLLWLCSTENPTNSMKMQKDRTLKDELPRLAGAQYATGDQQRNNSRKNDETEPKQKQHPVVNVTCDRSKVQCCKAILHRNLEC